MSNPVRLLTSGVEQATRNSFYAASEWRFVERVRWWTDYEDTARVVFGHCRRWWDSVSHELLSKGEPYLFSEDMPGGWHLNHQRRDVGFCIDYSAGVRYRERKGREQSKHRRFDRFHGRLAAMEMAGTGNRVH